MRGPVGKLDFEQRIDLRGRQAIDENGLTRDRAAFGCVIRVLDPRARHRTT